MSFSINTNVASLQAQDYLRTNENFQDKTINEVTSGLRIVQSGDDAAGLAIANGYRSNEAVLTQGIQNANDGLSQLQIIDGGESNISQLLDRARTLATQSATGTFTGDRTVLNQEFQSVLGEIDRQAQSIGLNIGGTFAKSLSVFIGGGQGTSNQAAIQNGSVQLDLSKATVDTKSLGLTSYQAVNATPYDLSASSTTSVADIVGSGGISNATFYFSGAGFSAGAGATGDIAVNVDMHGVTDTNSLVSAINTAIYNEANPTANPTAQQTAFKNAGITASIVTDSTGRQMLSFNSSNTAFQVRGGDDHANALLGNFTAAGTPTGTHSSTASAGAFTTVSVDDSAQNIYVNGVSSALADYSSASLTDVSDAVTAINTILDNGSAGSSDVRAYADANGNLSFYSQTGKDFNVSFDTSFAGWAANTQVDSSASVLNSQGAQLSGQEVSSVSADNTAGQAYFFGGIAAASGDTQTVTLNAIKDDGSKASLSLSLDDTNANDLNQAIDTINTQIQANSTDPALQNIVAVKDGDGIRFMSTGSFSVTLGAATGGTSEGMYEEINHTATQGGHTVNSSTYGASGMADISSQASAENAVAALGNAVTSLGSAQATVGRGENLFNYAVNLAQSQVTNLATAESRIRDADMASEAANLTKAQILMQAGVAALAQANSAPQQVLSLLRS